MWNKEVISESNFSLELAKRLIKACLGVADLVGMLFVRRIPQVEFVWQPWSFKRQYLKNGWRYQFSEWIFTYYVVVGRFWGSISQERLLKRKFWAWKCHYPLTGAIRKRHIGLKNPKGFEAGWYPAGRGRGLHVGKASALLKNGKKFY